MHHVRPWWPYQAVLVNQSYKHAQIISVSSHPFWPEQTYACSTNLQIDSSEVMLLSIFGFGRGTHFIIVREKMLAICQEGLFFDWHVTKFPSVKAFLLVLLWIWDDGLQFHYTHRNDVCNLHHLSTDLSKDNPCPSTRSRATDLPNWFERHTRPSWVGRQSYHHAVYVYDWIRKKNVFWSSTTISKSSWLRGLKDHLREQRRYVFDSTRKSCPPLCVIPVSGRLIHTSVRRLEFQGPSDLAWSLVWSTQQSQSQPK